MIALLSNHNRWFIEIGRGICRASVRHSHGCASNRTSSIYLIDEDMSNAMDALRPCFHEKWGYLMTSIFASDLLIAVSSFKFANLFNQESLAVRMHSGGINEEI
jgi:hypothetical protein